MRDEIVSFPALRAHQVPAWHMFLAQLGAITMHRAGLSEPSGDEAEWHRIIRALTAAEFPNDEPWCLVVDDLAKPAFLQPPVPAGEKLGRALRTPDALDMVITSKNHDLKGEVAVSAAEDDWVFALVSLQTCEGYGGSGNNGIARMNGGSSSRVCLGLVPMAEPTPNHLLLSPGVRLRRDLEQLAARRAAWLEPLAPLYPAPAGTALLWTLPWPDGAGLPVTTLDALFIEVCRRVRLTSVNGRLAALAGTSDGTRVAGKEFKGALGDPWAPINKAESKSLTLGEDGDFDYAMITRLLSGEWQLPLLATLGPGETARARNWALVAQAFARGNSKTGGFKERVIPVTGKAAAAMGPRRPDLHSLAAYQIRDIEELAKTLRNAIALAAVGGDRDAVNEDAYAAARPYREALKGEADRLFFPALWRRFDAEDEGSAAASAARADFLRDLDRAAVHLLDVALADLPCSSLQRPRAEARARARYFAGRKRAFEGVDFHTTPPTEAAAHADA
ncbi:MAG: hypothetical protein ACKVP7_08140 [Hyphomicrobiaceae bacterium]